MEKLMDDGMIRVFMALLNPEKTGFDISAITLIKVDANKIVEASDILAMFDESHHLFRSTGSYDLVSVIHARKTAHLNELIEDQDVWGEEGGVRGGGNIFGEGGAQIQVAELADCKPYF